MVQAGPLNTATWQSKTIVCWQWVKQVIFRQVVNLMWEEKWFVQVLLIAILTMIDCYSLIQT